MCLLSARARAHILLAALLLPVCALAGPLRLQLTPFASEVPATTKELQPKALEERTRYGLQEALKKNPPNEFELLPANSADNADLFVTGKVVRQGARYRITYSLQTNGPNRAQSSLNYDFATPRLTPKGVVVMAKDMLDEARKLAQASAAAPVASATPPPATAAPGSTAAPAAAPAGAAPPGTASPGTAPADGASTAQGSPPIASEGLPTPRRYAHPSDPGAATPGDAPRRGQDVEDKNYEGYGDASSDRERNRERERDRDDADVDVDDFRSGRRERRAGELTLDIGATSGVNSPGGFIGLEAEYRAFSRLGFQASGGLSLGGIRLEPTVKLYPFGYTVFAPFIEAGLGVNLGGTLTSTDVSSASHSITFPVTYSVTGCIGARVALGRYVYLSGQVGWAQPLKYPPLKYGDGTTVDPVTTLAFYFLGMQNTYIVSSSLGFSPF